MFTLPLYDQASSKQPSSLALRRELKRTQTLKKLTIKGGCTTRVNSLPGVCQPARFSKIRFVKLCLAGFFFFLFHFFSSSLSRRHSSNCRSGSGGGSSGSLQLKPCVVEKQASVCGEAACLEWEGARRSQRSQFQHADSSRPSLSHTPR